MVSSGANLQVFMEGVNKRSQRIACHRTVSSLSEKISVTVSGNRNVGNICGVGKTEIEECL